ncbi:phosphoribosylaminoimidazolesuccinocarboxamide synthase [Wohlfahrtiimonas chitiniclastica]|uniref:phosphoribosylaminoimidazolesuccinocarboxamide synthase n=1 Tax=Wohlfahrtiimonas chitiniclastica TaxID=400946 RepID=UPI001BCF0ADC|nr:phosphoribosylaminoimidazolesuccinocarboxamide synthase [Wohlfahrtiimonas chitiniclastica]MBS7837576.1 phosphoribosylaminoimidazolesuccinocarboxamide synthase [Wohlfahrtiimonas chitiniclastica]
MKNVLLYEGKAKQIYSTNNPDEVIIYYKDDATAGNGAKKAQFEDKGRLNSEISRMIFAQLMKDGIKTHLIKAVNEREQLCHKVDIILLEAIVRNIAAGSLVKRIGLTEGETLNPPILEFCYKNDAFNDPLINDDHAIALGLATQEELNHMRSEMLKINEFLKALWLEVGIDLVDFKIEFGRMKDGTIVLADEISPDTCRLWDSKTHEKLDKDRFRQDMGGVIEAYQEIHRRLEERSE